MKILAFAKNEAELKRILMLAESNREEYDRMIAVGNISESDDGKIARRDIKKYVRENTSKIATIWLKNWASKKIIEEKNFKQLMLVDGFSWWWAMEHWLYSSYAYMDSLKNVIADVYKIRKIINEENPDKIYFINDDSLLGRSILCVARNSGKEYSCINQKSRINLKLKNMLIKQFLRHSFLMRRQIGNFYKRKAKEKIQRENKNENRKKILAIAVYNWANILNLNNGKTKKGNPYITTIMDELKNDFETKYVDIPYGNLIGLRMIKEKVLGEDKYDLIECYYNGGVGRRISSTHKNIMQKWTQIISLNEFKDSFVFDSINIWELAEPQFNCYFSTRLEAHVRDFELIREMINLENPRLAVYSSDIDEFGRMLFYFCSQKQIPTLAIQHGTWPRTLPLLIYKKSELTGETRAPLPTKLSVYGNYYRDLLVRLGNYPEEGIAVCGNQRYDYYEIMKNRHIKDELCREFKLDRNRKTIMLLTQPLPSMEERIGIIDNVCKAVREIPNSQLIIKLHPGEASDAMHRRIIRENKLRNYFVTKDTDNFKLIFLSDAVIGPVSTLDYEAMLLEKPIVILNLSRRAEELPFIKDGSAIGVYEKRDIAESLKKALFDRHMRKQLIKNMRKTVKYHLYRDDGLASRRIAEVARRLAE